MPSTDSTMKGRAEDCVVMLPLGNRTGSVRMLSLVTGRLVNRDQFRVLPMQLSVFQRMNEFALKDGRVKGKGELSQKPNTYIMQSGVGNGLLDTIITLTSNGVDPSFMLDSDEPNLDLAEPEEIGGDDIAIPDDRHEGNRGDDEGNGSAEDVEMQTINTDFADDVIPLFIPHGKPKDVDMGDLIHSFEGLGSGRYDDEGIVG